MHSEISLIVGLGNPGAEYAQTRHNVGFWLVERWAARRLAELRAQAKFFGQIGRVSEAGRECWLLKPSTFMNRSGQSVQALANYYQIPIEQILVVHDELDLPPGAARLKLGGGHGGHNGLRDIFAQFGSEFLRLRLGIGHPGAKELVTPYVLGKPSEPDRRAIDAAIDVALDAMPLVLGGEIAKAMNVINRSQATVDNT